MKEEKRMQTTIADIGEFGLIDRVAHDLIYRPELVKIGAGDDGAVYRIPAGYDEVISTDTMVEGIHFAEETMSPYDVGCKLCASNFSDMAAMGAEAVGFVISAALPKNLPVSWVEACYEGIRCYCRKYRVNLLGGDVTGSPKGVILTGTVIGMVPTGQAVTRKGAKPRDLVFVTGTIGDSAAGLAALFAGIGKDWPTLTARHQRPEPQIEKGGLLREAGASSLNDISDGLSSELNEIIRGSHVTIEIDREKIPISKEAKALGEVLGEDPISWALYGGEDYQLVGTISREGWDSLSKKDGIAIIGEVKGVSDGQLYMNTRGEKALLSPLGYDHFKKGGKPCTP